MYLSPCANYEIRRMLKEHVDRFSLDQAKTLNVSESMNLNNLLLALYPRKFERVAKVRNLEVLADLYRQVSGARSFQITAQDELRRQIFQVLGIRFGVSETRLPLMVSDAEVSPFPFFCDGEIRNAMLCQGKFYGKVDVATLGEHSQLYQLASVLVEQGLSCLITTTSEVHSLWVGLRSPVYAVFLKDGIGAMRRALALHSMVCRFKQATSAVY